MKRMIPVTVRDRIATKTGDEEYICGNSDFTILFDFDAEWDAWPTKTARFTWAGNYHDVLFEGSECPVPVISDVFHFKVGVYAGNLRTTTAARVPAKKSVLCGGGIQHEPPAADVYNEILEKVNSRPTQEQMEKAIDQEMDAEFFIIHVDNNVSDKSDEEIRAAADEGKVCVAAVKPFGWLFTYVGDRPSSDDSSVYCPTFTLVWYKEYGKMTALDLEVHGNTVKVRGRDNVNLPNPYKLTLTGAVSAEYDGSEQVTVKIPTIAGPAGKDGYTPQKGIDYFDGKDGPIGPAGADGFNPEVRLERTEDGVKITAVNQDGEESQTVYDGKDGADTEFFIVRIGSNNVSDHTEEEIQAAIGEGKMCIAIGHTGEIYTYVGRMRKTYGESGYAATFYMPMKHAGVKADVNCIQISGNQAYHYLRDDARLANPWKLTLTGAVEAEYDGSKQTTVKIPTIAGPAGKDGYTPQKGIDYFDGKDGKDGATGPAGADGYSPTITLTRITGGVRIDAQNKSGTQTATVYDGKDGEGGTGGGGGLPTGGEPHQMLVTDGEGNTKWDERTHWKEEGLIDVLPEVTINVADFGEDASELPIMQPFSSPIVVGEEYVVTYNGAEYTTTAFELKMSAEAPPLPALGNQGAIGGEDTGEPFVIIYLPDEFKEMAGGVSGMLMPMDGAALIALRIQMDGVEYHKLDPVYLPIPITGGMIDILPETTASVSEEMGGAIFTNPLHGEIVIGNKYTVTYNGTEYVCTAWAAPSESGSDAPALGNKAMIGEDDTGEPFVFLYIPPEMLETTGGIYAMLMPRDGATEVTVSIRSEVDLKIDNSVLDLAWIPKKESVGATILPTVSFVGGAKVSVSIYDKIDLDSTYVVLFDGVRYECVAQEYMGIAKLLGNPSVMGITNIPGRGEPFCVTAFTEEGTSAQVAENDTAFHEVAVYEKGNAQKVANVLPNEFMPSGVMRSLCIMSSNYTAYLNGDDISENPTYTSNMGASGVVEALKAGELSNVCLYEYNGANPCVFHSVGIYIVTDVVHILMSYRDPYGTNEEQLRTVEITYGDIKVTEVT